MKVKKSLSQIEIEALSGNLIVWDTGRGSQPELSHINSILEGVGAEMVVAGEKGTIDEVGGDEIMATILPLSKVQGQVVFSFLEEDMLVEAKDLSSGKDYEVAMWDWAESPNWSDLNKLLQPYGVAFKKVKTSGAYNAVTVAPLKA